MRMPPACIKLPLLLMLLPFVCSFLLLLLLAILLLSSSLLFLPLFSTSFVCECVCLRVECEMVDGVICYLRLFCATAAAVASSGEKPTCPESEDGEGHQKHLRHPRQ